MIKLLYVIITVYVHVAYIISKKTQSIKLNNRSESFSIKIRRFQKEILVLNLKWIKKNK